MQAALRLLLTLTLMLNGLSPVWAGAEMAHGQHQAQGRLAEDAAPIAHHHAAEHDHASMHDSGVGLPLVSSDAEPDQDRACCDDPSACQCGCVLPPAMLLSLRLPALDFVAVAPAPRHVGGLALAAIGPPFRPPSA